MADAGGGMAPDSKPRGDRSGILEELRQIISEVIDADLSEVDVDQPLLDFVISSMAVVEGMRRIQERFKIAVSIRRVVEEQSTLASLAALLERELGAQRVVPQTRGASGSEPQPSAPAHACPFAPRQRHIGFLMWYSNEASAAFNESVVTRWCGPLDEEVLKNALKKVTLRHPALRTALGRHSDGVEIHSGLEVDFAVEHRSAKGLDEWLGEIVRTPFAPGELLCRLRVLAAGKNDQTVVLLSHALVTDGAALRCWFGEILDQYADLAVCGATSGQGIGAPPVTVTAEETETPSAAASPERVAAEAFWKDIFSDNVPRLDLPIDLPRPAVKNYRGASVSTPIPADLAADLEAWSASRGMTPAATWMSVLTAFLSRISQQREVVVGVGMPDAGAVPGVGHPRGPLPVRCGFDPESDFEGHCLTLASRLTTARQHALVPFAEIVQLVRLPRDQSRSPLFAVGFRHECVVPLAGTSTATTTIVVPPVSGARYDLELILYDMPEGPALVCDYSSELFEAASAERFLASMLVLAAAGIRGSLAVGDLPLLDAVERERQVVAWNATGHPLPRDRTVLDLVLERVRERGGQVAVCCGDVELTYGELGSRVEGLAYRLAECGVGRGDRVGVLLERSTDLLPSVLAVWRLGGVYVPLDELFPDERLAFMAADADLAAVLTSRRLSGRVASVAAKATAICVEEHQGRSPALPLRPPSAGDSSYVMYTSGSTGQPKGVEIGHAGLVNFVLATRELLGFDERDRLLALTTISFDISLPELLVPLVAGGVVDIGEEGLAADGLSLVAAIESRRPSFVQATPSTWKAAIAAGYRGHRGLTLIAAGEAIGRDLAEQLLVRCRTLWNLYGPTETTVFSAAYRVTSAPGQAMRIGRPYANTQIYIVDRRFQLLPVGAVGELVIGGAGLARGYWRRPGLTAERFVPSPFGDGQRLYRTGDLARILDNGDIVCLGRIDDQVKVHGVRVELGEIEAALRSVAGIADAVASSFIDASGDRQLVAHMIPGSAEPPAAATVKAELRSRLPPAMVPPHVLFTNAFPLTANGKIHRASLPLPVAEVGAPLAVTPPKTPSERVLAAIWAEVLDLERGSIGRDDDFLDIGGHSLRMTPLLLAVRKSFAVTFTMRELFAASTLRKLAALIDQRRRTRSETSAGRSDRGAEWGRQRMKFLERESELPRQIAPARGLVYQPPGEHRHALLTGATGFLGAYIVADILRTTEVDLHCLVRPRRGEDPRERIERQLRHYRLWSDDPQWQDAWRRRLHVVEGDVTLPRLGIADTDYERLAHELDCILHSAAQVNFIYPYEALRATNVTGLWEIVRLAFRGRITPLHYLSTAAIWPMGAELTFYEKDSIDHGQLLNLGYDESKWVAEKCLLQAAERGLPVARYRPGEVGGDSTTGRCVLDHFLIASLKGFLQFGAFPALDILVDVAPVDYVARAIVYLSFRGDALGRAFHLTNPRRRPLAAALDLLRGLGYRFDELPFELLRDRLVDSENFVDNALFPYQAMLQDFDSRSLELPNYDCSQTERALAGSGIACPPADEKLFGTYLGYLREVGFVPEPPPAGVVADSGDSRKPATVAGQRT